MLCAATALLFTACDDDNETPAKGKLNVEFENVAGSQPLNFGSTYTTAAGDPFTVSKFNYYISNIKLTKTDGTEWAERESYHLVKQADAGSRSFQLTDIPAGEYKKLTFTIGVDSARNVSGAQTGALDPLNDMFWTWSTGYVFLKMEGNSPKSPTGNLQFHIGGFRSPNNTIRTVSPGMPAGVTVQVTAKKTSAIHLQADVLKMFTGPNPIQFAQTSNTGHSSDPNSVKIAANYAAGMFTIAHVRAGE
ncbi:hypothetical protein B0919_19285 [Hymenobacter sp. CRA2]|nr:hypothetical protein B0919_19285 [Hymenobacter sp. CRA2]